MGNSSDDDLERVSVKWKNAMCDTASTNFNRRLKFNTTYSLCARVAGTKGGGGRKNISGNAVALSQDRHTGPDILNDRSSLHSLCPVRPAEEVNVLRP